MAEMEATNETVSSAIVAHPAADEEKTEKDESTPIVASKGESSESPIAEEFAHLFKDAVRLKTLGADAPPCYVKKVSIAAETKKMKLPKAKALNTAFAHIIIVGTKLPDIYVPFLYRMMQKSHHYTITVHPKRHGALGILKCWFETFEQAFEESDRLMKNFGEPITKRMTFRILSSYDAKNDSAVANGSASADAVEAKEAWAMNQVILKGLAPEITSDTVATATGASEVVMKEDPSQTYCAVLTFPSAETACVFHANVQGSSEISGVKFDKVFFYDELDALLSPLAPAVKSGVKTPEATDAKDKDMEKDDKKDKSTTPNKPKDTTSNRGRGGANKRRAGGATFSSPRGGPPPKRGRGTFSPRGSSSFSRGPSFRGSSFSSRGLFSRGSMSAGPPNWGARSPRGMMGGDMGRDMPMGRFRSGPEPQSFMSPRSSGMPPAYGQAPSRSGEPSYNELLHMIDDQKRTLYAMREQEMRELKQMEALTRNRMGQNQPPWASQPSQYGGMVEDDYGAPPTMTRAAAGYRPIQRQGAAYPPQRTSGAGSSSRYSHSSYGGSQDFFDFQ